MASVIKILKISYFLIIISYVENSFSEIFSALSELEKLVKTEKHVIENIENYVSKERKRLYVLNKFLKKYEQEYKRAKDNVTSYLSNPINAFTIIKSQTADFTFIQKKIKEKSAYTNLRKKSLKTAKKLTFPTKDDVDGSLEALALLQRIYKMNITEFASGRLFGKNGTPLTSSDCYKIGGLEYKAGYYNETLAWMTEALTKYKRERVKMYPFTEMDIMEYISYAYLSLDDIDNALEWNDKLKLEPTNPRYVGRAVLLQRHKHLKAKRDYEMKQNERRIISTQNSPSVKVLKQDKLLKNFIELCRGGVNLPAEIIKRLKCSYLTENHPYLRLAPLKMEQLFLKPNVIMFHGVMSDDEIEHIKALARPLLKSENLTSDISSIQKEPQTSFSKLAWLKDEESDVIARVSRRIADMTGMDLASADRLQVTNYGIGGHDKPKMDYVKNNATLKGNRASVIFYNFVNKIPSIGQRISSLIDIISKLIFLKMRMVTGFSQITSLIVLLDYLARINSLELYTALVDMEPLVKTQKCLIENLEEYIKNDRKRIYFLRENLKHFKDQHEKAMQDVQNYLENPINSYTLIKRLTTNLDFLERKIRERTEYKRVLRMTFPKQQDLDGALQALIRLQRTYGLNVTQFASGILFSNDSSSLTSYDCFMIGTLEFKDKHFNETILWMEEALNRYKAEQDDTYPFNEFNITDHIVYSYLALDKMDKALEWNNKIKLNDTDPRYITEGQLLQRHRDIQARLDYEIRVSTNNTLLQITDKKINKFNELCRGHQTIPGYIVKRLKCRYFTGHHPFLRLAPLKLEQLYINPNVYMFHKVISDSEIDRLKTLAKPLLHRGFIRYTTIGHNFAKETRIVQIAWLADWESSTVEKLSRRVNDMTGLSVASSEFLQIGIYGIGGYYEPHFDVSMNRTNNNEKARPATVLFYLSNVEQGGATVFLRLGLTVFPEKGSALFWKNLDSSGYPDFSTFHAACPVLHGYKWIATKWLHQHGQELIRPCKLKEDLDAIPSHHYQWWI